MLFLFIVSVVIYLYSYTVSRGQEVKARLRAVARGL